MGDLLRALLSRQLVHDAGDLQVFSDRALTREWRLDGNVVLVYLDSRSGAQSGVALPFAAKDGAGEGDEHHGGA